MERKESLGWELKRMSNTIGSFIGAELTKAGFDEIIITHGWILGYLCHHEDTDRISEGYRDQILHAPFHRSQRYEAV